MQDNRPFLDRLLKVRDPTFTVEEFGKATFSQRVTMCSQAFAAAGWGFPTAMFLLYFFKMLLFVWVWALVCGEDLWALPSWAMHRAYFAKAFFWAMSFESLGLGCCSGPLSGKNLPPFTAVFHFLWPGTMRYPLFSDCSIDVLRNTLGKGMTRGWLDVGLYVLWHGLVWRVLLHVVPSNDGSSSLPLSITGPPLLVLGVVGLWRDKTIWLASRGEHYWVMSVALLAPGNAGLAACKFVAVSIWFWAGSSKLFPHFSYVFTLMNANHPLLPWWARRMFYKDITHDLRPSWLAHLTAHVSTAYELLVPLYLAFGPFGVVYDLLVLGFVFFHAWIFVTFATAVPQEWQGLMIYHSVFLFSHHQKLPISAMMDSPLTCAFVVFFSFVLPLVGAFWPHLVSFLVAFRYYAGNWNLTLAVFPGERHMDGYKNSLKLSANGLPTITDVDVLAQLPKLGLSEAASNNLTFFGITFALGHLPFRALMSILPLYVPKSKIEGSYITLGEFVVQACLGWNFGDGHLLKGTAIRWLNKHTNYKEGEFLIVDIESAPLFSTVHSYCVWDVAVGDKVGHGTFDAKDFLRCQPWETTNLPTVADKRLKSN